MASPVRVLILGTSRDGPCSYFRGSQFDPVWPSSVEVQYLDGLDMVGRDIDTSPLEWADVLMMRRYYPTKRRCILDDCLFYTDDPAEQHEHETTRPSQLIPAVLEGIVRTREKALVYDTDDDLLRPHRMNGYYADIRAEQELIHRLAGSADLVTCASPNLAALLRPLNRNVRVIRNAIDPDLYTPTESRPETSTRIVYYGSLGRFHHYSGYHDDKGKWVGGEAFRAAESVPCTRVYLGWEPQPLVGMERLWPEVERNIRARFHEVREYARGIRAFGVALANTHPDIGLTPITSDDFDRAKSELHWLEYSMTGGATVASRFSGPHPYDVIRHGVDGMLARGYQEWQDAVKLLVRDPEKRQRMAEAARERVLREYHFRDRVHEWADAFTWAAENRQPLAMAA